MACADGSVPKVVEREEPESTEDEDSVVASSAESDRNDRDARQEQTRQRLLDAKGFVAEDAARSLDPQSTEKLQEEFRLRSSLSNEYLAFVGPMALNSPKALAILKPGSAIEVIVESGHDAEREWNAETAPRSFVEPLPSSAVAARMIDDDRLELVVQEVIESGDGSEVHLAIYKVIGKSVARVFGHPVALQTEGEDWMQTHEIRILNGSGARWIEIRDVDSSETARYEWNPWEGMYRIPEPVPTAPGKSPTRRPKTAIPAS